MRFTASVVAAFLLCAVWPFAVSAEDAGGIEEVDIEEVEAPDRSGTGSRSGETEAGEGLSIEQVGPEQEELGATDLEDAGEPRRGYKDPDYTTVELKGKVKTYGKMKRTGNGLLAAGIPVLGAGAVAYVVGMATLAGTGEPFCVALMLSGSVAVDVGVPLTIVGGVLSGIGGKKYNEYRRRLSRVMKVSVAPDAVRFTMEF